MTSNLMPTEKGGEQTQYESEYTDVIPKKKSGGQLGQPETAVDMQPEAAAKQKAERGEKTAENIRYGQAISETGAGGFTSNVSAKADQVGDTADAVQSRKAEGYGGEKDMNREIGA